MKKINHTEIAPSKSGTIHIRTTIMGCLPHLIQRETPAWCHSPRSPVQSKLETNIEAEKDGEEEKEVNINQIKKRTAKCHFVCILCSDLQYFLCTAQSWSRPGLDLFSIPTPMLKINTRAGLQVSDLSKSAYLARDTPPGLCGEHPAAVQTGRRAIYREALGSWSWKTPSLGSGGGWQTPGSALSKAVYLTCTRCIPVVIETKTGQTHHSGLEKKEQMFDNT